MSLKSIKIKSTYRSSKDNILNDFYIPVLEKMKSYDRAVGYFSSSLLIYALQGVRAIVKNNGEMRLIVGFPLKDDEFQAVIEAKNLERIKSIIDQELKALLDNSNSDIEKYRIRLFTLLVATGRLKVKFAAKTAGMYHEKIGIITDSSGNKVLFAGSNNETTNAVNTDLNFESFSVYRSWQEEIYSEYALAYETGFEDLWNNREKGVITIDMPSTTYEEISKAYLKSPDYYNSVLNEDEYQVISRQIYAIDQGYPRVPEEINGRKFQLFTHQHDALRNWWSHGKKGIFRLATGAGKTITAMYGITKLFELWNKPRRLVVVISVPYVALADQWVEELKLFNMKPVCCYTGNSNWPEQLDAKLSQLLLGSLEFLSVVVVNKTLISNSFKNIIRRVESDSLMFIGDECHRLASQNTISNLPEADLRIGLSATPFIDSDEFEEQENTEKINLLSYFGNVVADFPLHKALSLGILTPYLYRIVVTPLSDEEFEDYKVFTKEIGRQMHIDKSSDNTFLANAIRERNRILSSASNKSIVLNQLLNSINFASKAHTLFYVGEGKSLEVDSNEEINQIQVISEVLADNGWKVSKFTSTESRSERKRIMEDFKLKNIDGLVSMRVLDEGIDIPQCHRAFILASSRNERQFVQRRGRILRRSPGKDHAEIFDFVIVPPKNKNDLDIKKNLVRREFTRVMDFVRLADNRSELEHQVQDIIEYFQIDYREL